MPHPDPALLPYPIARVYSESLMHDDGPEVQFQNTVATYSALLRFIALVSVSQFLSDKSESNDPEVIKLGKMTAGLRSPALQTWFTAINSLRKYFTSKKLYDAPYPAGGPFSKALFQATVEFGRAREGSLTLHDSIAGYRNTEQGHHEGTSAEAATKKLEMIRPLVLRALSIFGPALADLHLLRRTQPTEMTILDGPCSTFTPRPIQDIYLEELFDTSPVVLQNGADFLPLFPLVIPAAGSIPGQIDPVLAFDGYCIRDGKECVKYRGFQGQLLREEEYASYRRALDVKNVSPYIDKTNFAPWSIADWAHSETRLTLDLRRSSKYRNVSEFYRERPGVEDRVRSWLDAGLKPALLITADAGFGKTSLFCKMAEELLHWNAVPANTEEDYRHVVVLILGSDIRDQTLFSKLCRALGLAEWTPANPQGFRDFRELLGAWRAGSQHDRHADERRIYFLLDAANEAQNPQALFHELSGLAKAANSANTDAGRTWVRLLVSVRALYLDLMGRKTGLAGDQPLIPALELFQEYPAPRGELRPFLTLPEFSESEAREVYFARGSVAPSCSVAWEDLHPNTQKLLLQPLLIDIFHTAFSKEGSNARLTIASEDDLWAEWFESVLSEDPLKFTVLRDFVFAVADRCLERGQTALSPDLADELQDEWDRRASRDERAMHRAADLNLFERLAALGVLRRAKDGGWEWRAQALAEQIGFRALLNRPGGVNEWLALPETALLEGCLALVASRYWNNENFEGLQRFFGSAFGERALARALSRSAPLGAYGDIRNLVNRYSRRLDALSEKPERFRDSLAVLLVWTLPARLEEKLGSTPVLAALAKRAERICKLRVDVEPENTAFLRDLSVSYNRLRDLDGGLDVARARERYEQGLKIAGRLAKLEPENTTFLRDLSIWYERLGDLDSSLDVARARERYQEGLKIRDRLVKLEPDNTTFLNDLSVLCGRLGDLDCSLDITRARERYEQGLRIADRLAKLEPDNTTFLRLLSIWYERLADLDSSLDVARARERYEGCLKIRDRLVELEPDNTTFLSGLPVLHRRLGDLDRSLGITRARERYEQGLKIADRLVKLEPKNTIFLSSLWISYIRLGDLDSSLDVMRARECYEEGLKIADRLVKLEPKNTTFLLNLSVLYDRLGDLDRSLDVARTQERYKESLKIRDRLVKLEPKNTTFLRSLSVSYNKLGLLDSSLDVARARERCEEGLQIANRLAKLEPDNTAILSELSISYERLGDLDSSLDVARARERYEECLKIRDRLVKLEPDNTAFLRGLSVLYDRLGDLDSRLDVARARERYEQGLKIRDRLVKLEPDNTTFLRDLSVSYYKLGFISQHIDARTYFLQGIRAICFARKKDPHNPEPLQDLNAWIEVVQTNSHLFRNADRITNETFCGELEAGRL